MKKLMKHFSCLLMVMLACIALPSCGDDEPDDSGDKTVKELLVGTWEYDEGDVYPTRMIFNADGTGKVSERYGSSNVDTVEFDWIYNDNTKILTMHAVDIDTDTEIEEWYIADINDKKAIVYWLDDGQMDKSDVIYLKKIK